MESAARTQRAEILLSLGDVEAAFADATKACDFGRSSGDPQALLPALVVQARVLFGMGKVREAGETVDELLGAMPVGVETSELRDAAPLIRELGRAPAFLGRLDDLQRPTPWELAARAVLSGDFTRAIDIYAELGAKPNEAETRLLAAREADEADPARRDHAARALEFFRSVGAGPLIREAEELLGISAGAGSRSAPRAS
jgi:hypothetical protein